jgi:hypothetical protein
MLFTTAILGLDRVDTQVHDAGLQNDVIDINGFHDISRLGVRCLEIHSAVSILPCRYTRLEDFHLVSMQPGSTRAGC